MNIQTLYSQMTTQGRISKHLLGAQRTIKGRKTMNTETGVCDSYEADKLNDKVDLHLLREQMRSLLDQIGSLKNILKDQSDEINRLNSANEQLLNVDRRMAYTQQKYRATKNRNEEMKQNLAMLAFQNNALKAEVLNLKDQLEKINQNAKEKELRIFEMNHCHQNVQKRNEDKPEHSLANLEAAKESRVSELESKLMSSAKKNDEILVEISTLRQEIAKLETRIMNEQDSRKQVQQHMSEDLQQALSSMLLKHDILSGDIAQLKSKLDSSVSLSKYSDSSHKEVFKKNLSKNDTESVRSSYQGEVANNAPINDNESVSELSVETIRDVESLRRVLGKLLPSYRQYFGDSPTATKSKAAAAASQCSKEKVEIHDNSSSRGKQENDKHLSGMQMNGKLQPCKLQRQKSSQDATPPELIKSSIDQLKSSKTEDDNTDFCGNLNRKKIPLESTFFTGIEIISSSRDPGQRSKEKGTNGKEQLMTKFSSSAAKVKDISNGEERGQKNQELSSTTVRYSSTEVLEEGEECSNPVGAIDSWTTARRKNALYTSSDSNHHGQQKHCLDPDLYENDSSENQLLELEVEKRLQKEVTLRHSSNCSSTTTSKWVDNSNAAPIVDLQRDEWQGAHHLAAKSKQNESYVISRKLKEDDLSVSDLFQNTDKSYLDMNHNGNVTNNFACSESSSLPALEPCKLMRFGSSISKTSNDFSLLDTEDIAKTKEQRDTAVPGNHVSPVAFDDIPFAERFTDSHELSNETTQNENNFSSGKKLSPISSFILEEDQNDTVFQMDITNNTTKSDDQFNTKHENKRDIYPSTSSEILLDSTSNYSRDQLLETTDVLSMIEEEISTNVSNSPRSYIERTY